MLPSFPASGLLAASFLDPSHLLQSLGLLGLLGIVFAECGLLVGFFFPGDSLLFTAGLLVANDSKVLPHNIVLVCALVSLAAVAGNIVGYWIGRSAGPSVFRRPQSRFFRPEYVDRTQAFFVHYGGAAIVMARFVPIVRTFITVMAGVGRMNATTYTLYSIVGGVLWGTGVTLLGFWLGGFAFVRDHIEIILIVVVLVSVVPAWFELRRRGRSTPGD
jgi:membrane-associated protein